MAKRFQFTQFVGYRNQTATWTDPFEGKVTFHVKPANDPDFLDWKRQRGNPMEALARRAALRAAFAQQAGEEPEEIAGLPFEQKLMHYLGADAVSAELEDAVNTRERAEEAAELVANIEGLQSYDDEDEEPEFEDVAFSKDVAIDLFEHSHGRIQSGEYKGRYVNDVLMDGVFKTAAGLAKAQEDALEEAAKN